VILNLLLLLRVDFLTRQDAKQASLKCFYNQKEGISPQQAAQKKQ